MTLAIGKALRVAFGETVAELGKTDPRIVVLDEGRVVHQGGGLTAEVRHERVHADAHRDALDVKLEAYARSFEIELDLAEVSPR